MPTINYKVQWRTNSDSGLSNVLTTGRTLFGLGTYRLKIRYNAAGALQIVMTDLDANETLCTYTKSDATGLDVTPTKLILGAKEDKTDHLGCHIKRIEVK